MPKWPIAVRAAISAPINFAKPRDRADGLHSGLVSWTSQTYAAPKTCLKDRRTGHAAGQALWRRHRAEPFPVPAFRSAGSSRLQIESDTPPCPTERGEIKLAYPDHRPAGGPNHCGVRGAHCAWGTSPGAGSIPPGGVHSDRRPELRPSSPSLDLFAMQTTLGQREDLNGVAALQVGDVPLSGLGQPVEPAQVLLRRDLVNDVRSPSSASSFGALFNNHKGGAVFFFFPGPSNF